MLKLIRLEMRKFQVSSFVKGALITTLVLLGTILLSIYTTSAEDEMIFREELYIFVDTLIRGAFIVYTAVLISKLVLTEFRNKTINVLFTTPLNRKKLIFAKLALVVLLSMTAIIIAQLLVLTLILIITTYVYVPAAPVDITALGILYRVPNIVMSAVAASVMGLIPLYFGMRKYSTAATIVASLVVTLIVCQDFGSFTLNSILIIPVTLAVIGAVIAYLTVKNIDNRDLA